MRKKEAPPQSHPPCLLPNDTIFTRGKRLECLCRVLVLPNNNLLKICAGSKGQRPRHFLCGQQEQEAALLWRKRLRLNERTDGVINLKRGMPRGTRCSFRGRERPRPRPGKRNASTFVASLKAAGCGCFSESWLREKLISW